ncbi:hypothetical protein RHMOL_Rhmol08G0128400 [Rhododendron molle]|uniref:Uncharacterized protein n=1 Tax=Rhododendron molle TaxID=49168 RepID=A0ACC0MMM6_RHOML|nr:hypothetical protein RHMOL_Rhmol08G0128400 [Rhododendron molle]
MNLLYPQTLVALTVLVIISISASVKPVKSAECNQTCGTPARGNPNRVPYPFGFSPGCGIPLTCTGGQIKIGTFQVQNITSDSILINLPAECGRTIQQTKQLFGRNYALTSQNGLLLKNCTSQLNGCIITTAMVDARFGSLDCKFGSNNVSCYSGTDARSGFINYDNLTKSGCGEVYSSIAEVDVGGDDDAGRNSTVSLQFQAAELGWWLDGGCECSADAECTNVTVPRGGPGYRCQCREGFVGDGFAGGGGCRQKEPLIAKSSDPNCSASKYMSGECGGRTRVGVLIAGIIAGAILMAAVFATCYFIKRRSRSLRNLTSTKRLLCDAAGNSSVPFYQYKEIERATNSFSEKQRLGTGAYGTVYAGKLHNNEWVAIKKIRHKDTDGFEQVMNEIKLLTSVSHPNLVRLLGCCIENDEQILVYEFMPNGTLSQHLQRERGKDLTWTIRLTIATETARAIAYLHSVKNPPIYHRDIKSSNILLDYNFNSKVADFGLSRLGMTDDSHISTAPQGTPGYVDPQYHQNFHLSDKSDVYSFGVVLVEIITALKVVDFSRPHSEVNLAALAIDRIGKGRLDEIIDPFLEPNRDAWTLSSLHKVAELAFRCLAFHRDMRPSMMEVADELEQIRLSGWAPLDENTCMASLSVASSCSSPYNGSEKFGGTSFKKSEVASKRLFVPQRAVADCLTSLAEVKDSSPVSVQDPWLSGHSSPASSSLLGHVVQSANIA